jgi:chromosomal replication initiation ATPase DnaA
MIKKDLLYYIQLYTGCEDHAIKRIEFLIDQFIKNHAPVEMTIVKEHINKIIYIDRKKDKISLPLISDFLSEFCNNSGVDLKLIKSKNRSRDIVRVRREYSIHAHDKGYTLKEIGRSINRDHTTIIHYLYHYKI